MTETLRNLETLIASRRGGDPASSYVAQLFAAGAPHIAKKFGEEAVETVIAALSSDTAALIGESADLLFHLLVLLNEKGVALADVEAELARREGVSGLNEKALRRP